MVLGLVTSTGVPLSANASSVSYQPVVFGKVTEDKLVHCSKDKALILVKFVQLPKFIVSRLIHAPNASLPIFSTKIIVP